MAGKPQLKLNLHLPQYQHNQGAAKSCRKDQSQAVACDSLKKCLLLVPFRFRTALHLGSLEKAEICVWDCVSLRFSVQILS